jgi:hypothetical protein
VYHDRKMNVFLALVAVLSLVAGAMGVLYGRAQARIASEMKARYDEQEREVNEWLAKFERVANQIVRLGSPNVMAPSPNANFMFAVYPDIFQDVQFRQSLENYVVELADNRTRFVQRKPSPHELRSQNLRGIVTKAEELLDAYRKNKPEIAKRYFPQ